MDFFETMNKKDSNHKNTKNKKKWNKFLRTGPNSLQTLRKHLPGTYKTRIGKNKKRKRFPYLMNCSWLTLCVLWSIIALWPAFACGWTRTLIHLPRMNYLSLILTESIFLDFLFSYSWKWKYSLLQRFLLEKSHSIKTN